MTTTAKLANIRFMTEETWETTTPVDDTIYPVEADIQDIANLDIGTISATSGSIELETNKVYSMSIDATVNFSLPATVDTAKVNQIKAMVAITGTPTIDWGTTYYYYTEVPTIAEGNYVFYWDWDNNLNGWVAGAIEIGAV